MGKWDYRLDQSLFFSILQLCSLSLVISAITFILALILRFEFDLRFDFEFWLNLVASRPTIVVLENYPNSRFFSLHFLSENPKTTNGAIASSLQAPTEAL
jgi:hypothetical protein